MGDWYRVAFGELYPLVYPHRNIAEASRVVSRLAPLVRASRPTLDVACGNGRYMCALQSAGLDVYGVDLSEYLLGEAVRAGLGGRVVCGDMRVLPFGDGVFGSAINMFTSFGYFGDDDNARVLREVARVLGSRGVFVLDFINGGRVRAHIQPTSQRRVDDAVVDEWRELSGDGRVLAKRVTVRWRDRDPVEYTERLRLYARDELSALLDGAGLRPREIYGDYELAAFDDAMSDRLIFVCERRSER